LYEAGFCLQAHRAAEAIGPLKTWAGRAERVLAGRLAGNLGAYRLAHVLHWLVWRSEPSHPDLAAYYGYSVLQRRGPFAALEFLDRLEPSLKNGDAEGQMHLFTLRATVAAEMRDVTASEQWLRRAAELAPTNPWVATSRAHVFETQDRYAEALEAAQKALALRPWYRPGVQAMAHALQLLDRDLEALAFLTEAARRLENMHVVRQLCVLQMELELHAEAAVGLARLAELAPLMEEPERLWLKRQRVTLDCLRNDTEAALAGAQTIDEPYYRELAARLQQNGHLRRKRLNVPFVRQHHMTCAPATLSAISRYWQQPAEHLEVAEAICYDGTPAHSERNWAETNGWVVREFRLTWETAVSLLDRGVPFTLTTSGATAGHLQAVVGYDEARQTLWIRDPFVYVTGEFLVKPLLEQQRATGPRGMALVPKHRRKLLDGLDLPEADLYDRLHGVERALAQHRRADALEVCQQMQAGAPGHRLTLAAQRALAAYDGNRPALLQCIEELLKLYPDDGHLTLVKLGCLRELARREERLQLLSGLCARPGIDPIFWQQYSQELRSDARQHAAAKSWVRWALRFRPNDPALISSWADLLWDQREFDRATRYYRLSACLGDKNEAYARSFFIASCHLRATDAALAFLQGRDDRLGKHSADPTITLVESLQMLRRTNEAFAALDAATARRPNDGALFLFAADFYGRFSRFDAAGKLLREARDRCSPVTWHRAAAALAGYQNEKQEALEHWRAVLAMEPLAHDAIRAAALLLAETEGREPVLRFLDDLCRRFPFSCPLLALRIQWLDEDGADVVIPPLRRLLEVNPADGWAWRELALKLADKQQLSEALAAVQEAVRLEPHNAAGYSVRAEVLHRNGKVAEGRDDFHQAIRLEVDNEYALIHFVDTAPTLAERKQALADVAAELRRQVIFSGALSAYQTAARGLLTPQEVLELLREAHRARPDLWQAWSVLVHQLIDVGNYEEARELARQACERFPLLPRLWVDLSRVEQSRLDAPAEVAALETALELSPGYAFASRQLAGIYERQGELSKARSALEAAVAANPLDALNHGCLAQMLWKQGEREKAIDRVQHALRLQPGYDWGWNALRDWSAETGKPDLAAEIARDLTRCRAGEARSWLLLANNLTPESQADELFAALDRALVLNARCEDAYDLRARSLARLNRFDEALAQCAPPVFQPAPAKLQIRAAWIEAQRGNLSQAIDRATNSLKEFPDFYAGWQLLADWHVHNQNLDAAVAAAQKMAHLAPLQPVPLGYLGDLKLRLQDKAGAQAAFERAFALDPDYEYAGYQLFHLQLEAYKLGPAEDTLNLLKRGRQNHQTLSCSVQLAGARQQWDRALGLFGNLCSLDKLETWTLATAAKVLDGHNQRREVDKLIAEQLSANGCAPALAEFWVERELGRSRWGLHKRLAALKAQGEIGRRAILRYLDRMGDAFQDAQRKKDVTTPLMLRYHLWRLLSKHRSWLATDLEGWGKVGFVLTCIGRPGPVIAWLGDWKNRPKAESWMLYNLVIMLQRKKRYEESREIIRHAVAMRHAGDLYESFRLWAAFEEALQGNLSQAQAHLSTLPAEHIKAYLRPVQAMAQILINLGQRSAIGKKDIFNAVRNGLTAAFGNTRPYQAARYVRAGYLRFLKVAARDSTRLKLWGWWYYRGTAWVTVLGLVLILPLAIVAPPLWIILAWLALRRSQRD
jgi:tetratricopeptide (TPR) repeat protein